MSAITAVVRIALTRHSSASDVPAADSSIAYSWASECLARNPLPQQRVDDDVAIGLARDEVFARQRDERGLYRRWPAEPVPCAGIDGHQVQALFEDDGAEHRALPEREPLPHGLEHRLLLEQQTLQGGVEILERRLAPAARADLVPGLVRQPLHVVGQVAGELDDGGAEAVLGPEAGSCEAGVDERREFVGRDLVEAHDRTRLVERPLRS